MPSMMPSLTIFASSAPAKTCGRRIRALIGARAKQDAGACVDEFDFALVGDLRVVGPDGADLVGFAPLAPSVFYAARQNAVLRRSPLRHT